jgi:hypothetical protein
MLHSRGCALSLCSLSQSDTLFQCLWDSVCKFIVKFTHTAWVSTAEPESGCWVYTQRLSLSLLCCVSESHSVSLCKLCHSQTLRHSQIIIPSDALSDSCLWWLDFLSLSASLCESHEQRLKLRTSKIILAFKSWIRGIMIAIICIW